MELPVLPIEEYGPESLKRRRSCELVNIPSPCVNKALFHLDRLKELLRLALQLQEIEEAQEIHKDDRLVDKHPKGWRQLRFEIPLPPSSLAPVSATLEKPKDDNLPLAIMGVGGQVKDAVESGGGERIVSVSKLEQKNQLTPPEVFTQVRELILRLEEDRRRTEKALQLEDKRVESLNQKIDWMCRQRLIKLPLAVQREHDACATDISELQWHVSYMQRQLERCKQRVAVADVLNKCLKDDIAFVKKHCPLVEEKLILEKEAMQKIKAMQRQTDKELADAKIELEKAERKYQEATEKAEAEREATRKKLEGIRGQLRLLKKDLQHSQAMYAAYVKKAEQSRQKLADQEQELIDLQNRAEEAKEEEQAEVYKIEDLRQQIKEVEFQTGEINKRKSDVESETEKMHEEMKAKIADMEARYHKSLHNMRKLQEENRDMKLDIEDMHEEIKTCDKVIAKCGKEIERYKKERERCDAQLKAASLEVQRVTVINNEFKTQLQKEESKSHAMEDALKTQADSLRKRVMEEMRQRTLFEAKKQSNSQALLKGKAENKKKRSKVAKTLKETEETVCKIREDVERLNKQHDATSKEVQELETQLAEVKAEHEKEETRLTTERDLLVPKERELFSEQMSLQAKLKEMEFEETQMQQKLHDMKVSKNVMTKRIEAAQGSITNLTEDLEENTLRLETGKKTNEELKKQLDDATKRLASQKKTHEEMMTSRSKVKQRLEKDLDAELIRNKELAQNYRDLQSEHIDLKNKLMSLYDNKVKLEENIKDHKQLLALQEKFNVALKQYYHDRGEFNKAGLQKFHVEAEDNSHAMFKVQAGLQKTLVSISKFLHGQIEGGAANQVHEAAMKELFVDEAAAPT